MTTRLRPSGRWIGGLALILVVFLAAPGLAPDARAAQFNVSLQGPSELLQYQNAELVAIVTDSQGHPVSGIPVEFRVAPDWENNVVLSPQSISTENGEARVVFESDMPGVIYMTAQVGDTTATTHITVSGTGSRRGGIFN